MRYSCDKLDIYIHYVYRKASIKLQFVQQTLINKIVLNETCPGIRLVTQLLN